ncbi:MAG: hypothetical protein ACI8X5_001060 [Planctomycetota bacterium]|jgi:hypothetical protein
MKLKTLSLLALLTVPALFAFQPRGRSISFHIAEGTTQTKVFTNSYEMSLDEMSMMMNGQASPVQPEIEMLITAKQNVTVTDEYVGVSDGAPTKLLRSYDEATSSKATEMEMDVMGQVQSSDSSSESETELTGNTVQFKWNAEGDEFVASFPDGEADEGLLTGLTEDMDLRALLPEDEVAEGDTWKIEPFALASIFSPGGDLKLVASEEGNEDELGMNSDMGDTSDWFTEDTEGEVTATFTGMREMEDGVNVAVITLQIEITNAADLTEKMAADMEDAELPPMVESMELESMDIQVEIEGEATLLWDVASGCMQSFELEAEISLVADSAMALAAQGQEMSIESSFELSGSITASVSIEE